MALVTSLSLEEQPRRGIPTQWMLLLSISFVITCCTAVSLLLVHDRMRKQVRRESAGQMERSLETWRSIEAQELFTLQQENALLSQLPSLKALMTTEDDRTIADSGLDFWKISGNDLFSLLGRDGRVRALYARDQPASIELRKIISQTLQDPNRHYLVADGRLFSYAVRPLYFGTDEAGTVLGYVVSGDAVDTRLLRQVSRPANAEASFLSDSTILADTRETPAGEAVLRSVGEKPEQITLEGEPYFAQSQNFSSVATGPLRLVLLKSLRASEAQLRSMRRLLVALGIATVLGGSMLMVLVAGWITHPLETLAQGVRAFGQGHENAELPVGGTLEVQQLSADFATMRRRIEDANRALVEKERLATVGSMASSVSHDLRHYLTAVYANAEFLATANLPDDERAELLGEIRSAVTGTTDLIDSLLVFSRTGQRPVCVAERIFVILQRALDLIRKHPDANAVRFTVESNDEEHDLVSVDVKQVERALFNLLLNAAQAATRWSDHPTVEVTISANESAVEVSIVDNGGGVPLRIRDQLFQPFVSEGKENGTGLGLTLAHRVAEDHGGAVTLIDSVAGHTEFVFSIKRTRIESSAPLYASASPAFPGGNA